MTTTVYSSADASAPSLSGTIGSLIALLDACLINGYGAKAAIGWTKPFSGTNVAVYRQPVGTSNGMYLRVDDTVAQYANVRGYETMSDINTGTGQFPLVGQAANVYWAKSSTADASVRPWILIGNERGFYLWSTFNTDTTTYNSATLYYFAELRPLNPSDVWGTVLYGDSSQSIPNAHLSIAAAINMRSTTVTQHRYAPRPFGGGAGAVGINYVSYGQFYSSAPTTNGVIFGNSQSPASALAYPNGPDTGLYLAPVQTIEVSSPNSLRGPMRGLWAPLHGRPLSHSDTFTGTGVLSGKTFVALSCTAFANGTGNPGQVFIETSNTWE